MSVLYFCWFGTAISRYCVCWVSVLCWMIIVVKPDILSLDDGVEVWGRQCFIANFVCSGVEGFAIFVFEVFFFSLLVCLVFLLLSCRFSVVFLISDTTI